MIEDEEDVSARESTKMQMGELAKLVGAKESVEEIAADLVEHYETRTSVLEGKSMIVVREPLRRDHQAAAGMGGIKTAERQRLES